MQYDILIHWHISHKYCDIKDISVVSEKWQWYAYLYIYHCTEYPSQAPRAVYTETSVARTPWTKDSWCYCMDPEKSSTYQSYQFAGSRAWKRCHLLMLFQLHPQHLVSLPSHHFRNCTTDNINIQVQYLFERSYSTLTFCTFHQVTSYLEL